MKSQLTEGENPSRSDVGANLSDLAEQLTSCATRLREAADDFVRIESTSSHSENRNVIPKAVSREMHFETRLVAAAKRELTRRRKRSLHLPTELFGEGAWAILLDLYVSLHSGRQVSTTSACIAADVPATTALRWLEVLSSLELIKKSPDGTDKRVKHIIPTPKGYQSVRSSLIEYLD